MSDVNYCPVCGESVPNSQTEFKNDLVLNRYRTVFQCAECGFHGEVFRHDAGLDRSGMDI